VDEEGVAAGGAAAVRKIPAWSDGRTDADEEVVVAKLARWWEVGDAAAGGVVARAAHETMRSPWCAVDVGWGEAAAVEE